MNINTIVSKDTLVVDALDNIETRYILAKETYNKKIPLFHAAVFGFLGQVSTFIPKQNNPCLFCFLTFNKQKLNSKIKSSVIGTTVGIVGSIQCNEVIKYIINKGKLLIGKVLIWDGTMNSVEYLNFEKDEQCSICGSKN